MSDLTIHAQPPLEFIPPALNPLVLGVTKQLLPLWMRSQTAITDIQAANVETLVDLYRQFQDGKTRFLIAFRHPSVDDPLCMTHLLWKLVPQVAKQQGISLKQPTHAHFIYDRGIPIWAGNWVGWFYSRLGGTSLHRGKADWTGLRSARYLFANSNLPMAAAPEGAVNGHNELISSLEPGIAQLGFWCVEDLLKAGRTQEVVIVPVGIQYSYLEEPWQGIEQLLSQLEAISGIELKIQAHDGSLYARLIRLSDHLLTLMEEFYSRFYHQKLPTIIEDKKLLQPSENPINDLLSIRLNALLNAALQVAEEFFDLPAKGNLIDRCRRLEQAGWNYIYREDFSDIKALERGLSDRIAEEASLRMWHMRLVETFVAVNGHYILEKPTAERFAETTLLLWDLVTRIKGSNPFHRPRLGKQRVQMTVGQPLSVSELYPTYHANRHGARTAVTQLTQDLRQALESLILKEG
ncbi:MAG: 1-acyl-sn-glycerol-3-phosphate acyltransferase [Coleofasciculaceae cyanobacterium]